MCWLYYSLEQVLCKQSKWTSCIKHEMIRNLVRTVTMATVTPTTFFAFFWQQPWFQTDHIRPACGSVTLWETVTRLTKLYVIIWDLWLAVDLTQFGSIMSQHKPSVRHEIYKSPQDCLEVLHQQIVFWVAQVLSISENF